MFWKRSALLVFLSLLFGLFCIGIPSANAGPHYSTNPYYNFTPGPYYNYTPGRPPGPFFNYNPGLRSYYPRPFRSYDPYYHFPEPYRSYPYPYYSGPRLGRDRFRESHEGFKGEGHPRGFEH